MVGPEQPSGMPPVLVLAERIRTLSGLIGQLQGWSIIVHLLLAEMLTDLARSQEDSHRYLADLFERISSNLESTAPNAEKKPDSEARQSLAAIFATATSNLSRPARGQD